MGYYCMTKAQKQYKLLILSDLKIAASLKDSESKSDRLMAAYHVQQAIEKTIKLKAEICGVNLWGHNIRMLIRDCDKRKLSLGVPAVIRRNADIYTRWEADCRYYPIKVVRKDSLNKAYEEVKNWLESGTTA